MDTSSARTPNPKAAAPANSSGGSTAASTGGATSGSAAGAPNSQNSAPYAPLGGAATGAPTSAATGAGEDSYPVIGTLETSIFGTATPTIKIEDRLAKLETVVYKKTFASETLFDRTERLKATLLGLQPAEAESNSSSRFVESGSMGASYFDAIAALPENQTEVTPEELQRYFFVLVNGERQKFGYAELVPDEIATKLAREHAVELCQRHVLSHQDLQGNNPDRRYTLAGGSDLLYESIVSVNNDTGVVKPIRAIAVNLLKTIMNRQDEREAIMGADATGLGFAVEWTKEKEKIVACSDVLTRHGVIQPIPNAVQVGEKIDVRGVVMPPFHFDKITVAWEGPAGALASVPDDSEEALPYFAPLDYTAYAHHSDNDHAGTITALKTAGIIAAIAGGVFIPPVALAAPMIAMSGSMSEPKPASDIPIKGGVKVDGNSFDGRVAINHEGKAGLYYLTVWASLTKYGKPIAISRRAIVATVASGDGSREAKSRVPKGPNEVDTEKVSAEVVGEDAPDANSKSGGKHKHKQDQKRLLRQSQRAARYVSSPDAPALSQVGDIPSGLSGDMNNPLPTATDNATTNSSTFSNSSNILNSSGNSESPNTMTTQQVLNHLAGQSNHTQSKEAGTPAGSSKGRQFSDPGSILTPNDNTKPGQFDAHANEHSLNLPPGSIPLTGIPPNGSK